MAGLSRMAELRALGCAVLFSELFEFGSRVVVRGIFGLGVRVFLVEELLSHLVDLFLIGCMESQVLVELRSKAARELADLDRSAPGEIAHDGAQGSMEVVALARKTTVDARVVVEADVLDSDKQAPLERLGRFGSDGSNLPGPLPAAARPLVPKVVEHLGGGALREVRRIDADRLTTLAGDDVAGNQRHVGSGERNSAGIGSGCHGHDLKGVRASVFEVQEARMWMIKK